MFRVPVQVRFGESDPAGIVYYPNILHYCHVAFEEFFGARSGVDYATWIQRRRIGFPAVRSAAEFRSPIRYGDTVDIAVTTPRVGGRSVDFHFELSRPEGSEGGTAVVAVADVTVVCTDLDTLRSRGIPEALRETFESGAERQAGA